MAIDCPSCGHECRQASAAPNVTHWYCPDCQPGYDPSSPTNGERVLWIIAMVALLPLAALVKFIYWLKP